MKDEDTKQSAMTDHELPPDLQAQLDALDGEPDTESIPEVPEENWKMAYRYHSRRIVRLDPDILSWLQERRGDQYESEVNRILRERMTAEAS